MYIIVIYKGISLFYKMRFCVRYPLEKDLTAKNVYVIYVPQYFGY